MCKIKIENEDGEINQYTKEKSFSSSDLKEAGTITAKAGRYFLSFKQLIMLDDID